MIPENVRPFFWDIEIEPFDPQAYPEYTIERLLELGTPEAIAWLEAQFTEGRIKAVVRSSKRLSPKSATFWALAYGIPFNDVKAIQ